MKNSYYLEIKVTKIASRINLDVKKIYRELHTIIGKSEGNIGVSFPDWSETSIGLSLRFFGSEEELQYISRSQWLNAFAEDGFIFISRIRKTPEVNSYVRFYRDRRLEKYTPGYLKRTQRRKNNFLMNKQLPIEEEVKKPKVFTYTTTSFHNVTMKSSSTQQNAFILRIVQEKLDGKTFDPNLRFSSYGLGQSGMGVPDF